MFPGKTNNEMLKLMQDCMGRYTTKLIRRAQFRDLYFDGNNNFVYREVDRITQRVSGFLLYLSVILP